MVQKAEYNLENVWKKFQVYFIWIRSVFRARKKKLNAVVEKKKTGQFGLKQEFGNLGILEGKKIKEAVLFIWEMKLFNIYSGAAQEQESGDRNL